jgi:hypothetical protein
MKDMTELTQALAAYLRAPVAQPLTEDSAPYICANAAMRALPNGNTRLRDVLPYADPWLLEYAMQHDCQSMDAAVTTNTTIEMGNLRRDLLRLAYRLAGGGISPEQAAQEVFEAFQVAHATWCSAIAGRELDLLTITNPSGARAAAENELNSRKGEAA